MSFFTERDRPLEESQAGNKSPLESLKQAVTGGGLAMVYGLLAVLTVAVIEFLFSLEALSKTVASTSFSGIGAP